MEVDEKNPFSVEERKAEIIKGLAEEGFEHTVDYEIISVPNITHITYGRDVGYKIEQEHLGEEVESISATKIRQAMIERVGVGDSGLYHHLKDGK